MKLLMMLVYKGTYAPVAPVMHPRSGVPASLPLMHIPCAS